MCLSIKQDAIFIADSHFNKKNRELLTFLQKIEKKEIISSQLFLMGDMIDFISCESRYFVKQNIQVIELLNKLSLNIQIIYLEGNHDYNLKPLFPKIDVIKREQQPFFAQFNGKKIALAHGDNFINWKYDLYCKFIRNSIFLKIMNYIDINFFISKRIEVALVNKSICHKINNFEEIVLKRIKNYNADVIIEGHYHQGKKYFKENKIYVNVPSLCCQKKYYRMNNLEFEGESI